MALKFSNLKSLFIVDDDEPAVNKPVEEKSETKQVEKTEQRVTWSRGGQTPPVTPPTANIGTQTTKPETNTAGEFNEQIFDSLTKALANANLPGEDYLEYIQALKAMKDIPMDENLKIQTIFATLSVKGLTVPKVLESADYYVSVLDNEKRKFYTALDEQGKGNINSKKKQISDIEKINTEKAQQIAALTEEIKANQALAAKLNNEIAESEGKLKTTENNFLVTFDKVVAQIRGNVTKIKTVTGS